MSADQPKKILMLLENESYPDDCRVYLEALSLVEAGYSVTVICPTDPTGVMFERVGEVLAYRYPKPWELPGFLGYVFEFGYSLLMQWLWTWFVYFRRGFDVIHMHTPPDFNAVIPIAFQLLGKKFVYDLHDLSPELFQAQRGGQGSRWIHGVLLWFERLACSRANRLIATNETQKSKQIHRCGAVPQHCYVVRNGPNEAFRPGLVPHPDLTKIEQTIIGYVGIIGVQDGVDYLIRALGELRTSRGRDDFHCVIVGDGPAWQDIQQLACDLDLDEYVTFVGRIPFADVPPYIAGFDICATPDHSNAYNDSCTTIKTMEYMALGKPTVCFETAENIKTAGEAALYASDNDVKQFAEKLERLMDDQGLRRRMGDVAQQRIDNGLRWHHQAAELVALYDDLFEVHRRDVAYGANRSPLDAMTATDTTTSHEVVTE